MDSGPSITLTVDGRRRTVDVDTRTTLLDALRERLGVTSPKKGCDHGQCGSCTVLLDGRRHLTCLALALSLRRGGDRHRRRARRAGRVGGGAAPGAAGLPRPRRAPVRLLHARPGVLGRGHARGGPAPATPATSPTTSRPTPTPSSSLTDEEIRERMSGNLCRCGAYVGILAAVREAGREAGDEAATTTCAPTTPPQAVSLVTGDPRRPSSPAAPTSSTTSSSASREPDRLVDVRRLPLDAIEERDGRDGPVLRIGANVRNSDLAAHPARAPRLPGGRPGAAGRRLGPDPAPGHHRRQPAAAHPVRLLPGRHHALQQARARHRLLGARGLRPLQRDPRRLPPTASPPTPPTWPWRSPRSTRTWSCSGPEGERRVPIADLHRLPGDQPELDTTLEHGELVTAVELPGSPTARRSTYARCATGRRTPSRWSRSPPPRPRRRPATRRATSASPGAAWRTSRGGRRAPRRRCAGSGRRPRRVRAAADAELERAATGPETAYKVADGPQRHRAGAAAAGRRELRGGRR